MNVLTRVEQEGAYSNLLLRRVLEQTPLGRADAALATELVYGTLQRLNTLDYWLNLFVAKGIGKLEPWVRNLLRLSLYQLKYLNRIPAHAAVNEAVQLAKRKGHRGISGMVNAVLRSVIREPGKLELPQAATPELRISLQHSHPEWLVSRWIRQYGESVAEEICAANNVPPQASVRVNALRADRDALLAEMQAEGLAARPSRLTRSGIVIENGGNLAATRWFAEGKFSIQDESSMLVAAVADPQPGMQVLDCCAAPGGKTAHLAELMKDRGQVWANDLHSHKEQLIRQTASRLGLNSIRTVVGDAAELDKRFPEASMDRILLDAPCTGFGVIRRKPDLKWRRQPEDIASVSSLQFDLLCSIQRLLKPGGVLVYSTCTIDREENEQVVRKFVEHHPDFELDRRFLQETEWTAGLPAGELPGTLSILPHHFHSDGFFIARLIKRA
jgi:16S rRNA (cytosine967-C5)-methyltransferase